MKFRDQVREEIRLGFENQNIDSGNVEEIVKDVSKKMFNYWYFSQPHVKAKQKKYYTTKKAIKKRRLHEQKPHVQKRIKNYHKGKVRRAYDVIYNARPEVRARQKINRQQPHIKKWRRKYAIKYFMIPKNLEKRRVYALDRYWRLKLEKELNYEKQGYSSEVRFEGIC